MTANPLDRLRRDILAHALGQVPFEGWSLRALRAGAAEAGLTFADAQRAFPRGVADALVFWSAEDDRRMTEALDGLDLPAMRVRDRIACAVRQRIEINGAHREAVRLALGRAALPGIAPQALAGLWRTVDAMWRAAGDSATDYNYYTKRGLLAGVYGATLLYWLDDRSDGSAETWAFLDRRIAEVMQVPKLIGRLKSLFPSPEAMLRTATAMRRDRRV